MGEKQEQPSQVCVRRGLTQISTRGSQLLYRLVPETPAELGVVLALRNTLAAGSTV